MLWITGTMISFDCSSSYNFLLESMPYRLLEFDYMLLTFLCVWDDLIESEGIDGNLWALHTRRYEPMKV